MFYYLGNENKLVTQCILGTACLNAAGILDAVKIV